ncbi:MAG: STM4504/CBY_0614 family protein [Armatimonadota bacterium]
MPIHDIFSRRQQTLRGELPDVFIYTEIPMPVRVQFMIIFDEATAHIGFNNGNLVDAIKCKVKDILCREYGELEIGGGGHPVDCWRRFLLNEQNPERVLDLIELSLQLFETGGGATLPDVYRPRFENAVTELNERFRTQGVGYQFEAGQIVRIDSQFLHQGVVKPALALLKETRFAGANQEFLTAHEHYRHIRIKECLRECGNAFESVMKIIYTERGWPLPEKQTAGNLVKIAFDYGLIPGFMADYFTGLQKCLEAAVPTPRNKLGGHGQGAEPIHVPDHFAAYVLHQTAAAILLLAEADMNLSRE